jgi:hypothetical protein
MLIRKEKIQWWGMDTPFKLLDWFNDTEFLQYKVK